MRIILDECLPRRLGGHLVGHSVTTVQRAGWAGLTNGNLLARVDGAYDAFITIDRRLPDQKDLSQSSFGVVLLQSPSNRIDDLRPLVPHILNALLALKPGELVRINASGAQP